MIRAAAWRATAGRLPGLGAAAALVPADLPAELAPPLHLAEPSAWRLLLWPALFALVLIALGLWSQRQRPARARARQSPPPLPPAAAEPLPDHTLASQIAAIRRTYDERRAWRAGCHALSDALRSHLARVAGASYLTSTVGEIRRLRGDGPVSRLFEGLADLQFGRQTPGRGEFIDICNEAVHVMGDEAGTRGASS